MNDPYFLLQLACAQPSTRIEGPHGLADLSVQCLSLNLSRALWWGRKRIVVASETLVEQRLRALTISPARALSDFFWASEAVNKHDTPGS